MCKFAYKLMSRIVNNTGIQIQFTLVHLGPLWSIPSIASIQSNSIHSVQKCPICSISVHFGPFGSFGSIGFIRSTSVHFVQSGPLHSFQSKITKSYITIFNYLYYYLRGFSCLGTLFFYFKIAPTPLYISRNKTKRQSGKNTTLTPTKTSIYIKVETSYGSV